MGFSVNKITIIGKLGSDAETRTTQGGMDITNLSVATDHSYKKNDKWETETTWHKVTLFKLSDFHRQSLQKGATVHVSGRIQNRSYDDKEGIKRYVTEIIGNNNDLIVFNNQSNGGSRSSNTQPQQSQQQDDSVPF